jgi:cell division protein FtsQ
VTGSRRIDRHRTLAIFDLGRAALGLGGVRPGLDESGPIEELGADRLGAGRETAVAGHVSDPGSAREERSAHTASQPGKRHTLLAAGLAGTLVFAVGTGFGRHVSPTVALQGEIDKLLIAAGLGINEVSLSGHRHAADQDIFRALGANGRTLLSLDVEAARRRIEALAWVETAAVVRVLPDKVQVEVRERKASAVWLDGERTALIDRSGRILTHLATYVPAELPRIAGPGAPEAAAELLAALARRPRLALRVEIARRIGGRRWDLELDNGTRVRLAAQPTEAGLDRIVAFQAESSLLDRPGQIIDMTIDGAIAVTSTAVTSQEVISSSEPVQPQHRL